MTETPGPASETPRDSGRLRRRLVLLLLIAVGTFAAAAFLQSRRADDDPRRLAADFLAAHAEVVARVGTVTSIEDVGTRDVSAGPGNDVTRYVLLVVGKRGTLRADVEMKKGPDGSWHVHSATLYTEDGPVPLIEPARCPTCSNV